MKFNKPSFLRATVILIFLHFSQNLWPQNIRGHVSKTDGQKLKNKTCISVWRANTLLATTTQDSLGLYSINLPERHIGDSLKIELTNAETKSATGPCPWDELPVYTEHAKFVVLKAGKNWINFTVSLMLMDYIAPQIKFRLNEEQADTSNNLIGKENRKTKDCILSMINAGLYCEIRGYAAGTEKNAINLAEKRAKWVKAWLTGNFPKPERVVIQSRVLDNFTDTAGFVIFNFSKVPFDGD